MLVCSGEFIVQKTRILEIIIEERKRNNILPIFWLVSLSILSSSFCYSGSINISVTTATRPDNNNNSNNVEVLIPSSRILLFNHPLQLSSFIVPQKETQKKEHHRVTFVAMSSVTGNDSTGKTEKDKPFEK